jgi:phosphoserine aminotransferase
MSQSSGVPSGQFNTRISNFTAGPGALPVPVLEQCQREMLNWNNCGASVMEISHRSKEFIALLEEAKNSLKKLLNIPDNYAILFMQGGGNGQFATVPMNLLTAHKKPQYVVTGTWSKAALQEAKKFCAADEASSTENTKFRSIPPTSEWQLDPQADYVYYCSNETINGVEFQSAPELPNHVPLIADMSSNFLSRPVDVSKFGLIWAGAQKNTGIAGLTVVIIRKDLLSRCPENIPQVLNYNVMHEHNSSYNTPPTFAIYVSGLVFKWLLDLGGLEAMEKINQQKAELLYSYIDSSKFYINEIDHACRSRMNVPFKVSVGTEERNKQLEQLFGKEANKRGLIGLEGHRSVGGLRASLYNAVSLDDVKALVSFMKEFAAAHAN